MFYITGDTHGQFQRIADFCRKKDTQTSDTMIILGDVGLNFHGNFMDRFRKEALSKLPITLFCIHGNHENRPGNIASYRTQLWNEGTVYVEDAYPNILFARDGEVFNLDGYSALIVGGAYSVDKAYRLMFGSPWWSDEQPSAEIKRTVEDQLDRHNWNIDVMLTHTVPIKYEPTEVFIKGIDQSKVDKSTEEWLGRIEEKLKYRKWYAGHYHINKRVDKLQLLFDEIHPFRPDLLQTHQIQIYEE